MGLRAYIEDNFSNVPVITGDFTNPDYDALTVREPSLLRDVTCHWFKYGVKKFFSGDMAMLDCDFSGIDPRDQYAACFLIPRNTPGNVFASGITASLDYVEGRGVSYEQWISYSKSNFDIFDLSDGNFYGEDIDLGEYADAAVDCKAKTLQVNRLAAHGEGHRTMRFWTPGPHFLNNIHLNNLGTEGSGDLFWFDANAAGGTVYIGPGSTFNGQSSIPTDRISGAAVRIVYVQTEAEMFSMMHPAFSYKNAAPAPGPTPDPAPIPAPQYTPSEIADIVWDAWGDPLSETFVSKVEELTAEIVAIKDRLNAATIKI